jgi:hypothetical protein
MLIVGIFSFPVGWLVYEHTANFLSGKTTNERHSKSSNNQDD